MSGEYLHDVDWEDLRHFAAFAEAGSLSRAAAALNVDHVTVARRVAALESALGLKLLDRRTRVPALTPDGVRIAERVARMADEAFAVTRAARGLQPSIGGHVSVSAPPTIATWLVAPRLPELFEAQPRVRVTLLGQKRMVSLSRREADVAIRLVRPTEPGLVARKLGAFAYGLYGSRDYVERVPPRARGFIALAEDDDALPQQRWLRDLAGGRPYVLRTNDLESQLAAVHASVGLAALPSYIAARHPELARVAVRARPITRDVWLVVHEDLRASPVVRAVIDFLVDAIRPQLS